MAPKVLHFGTDDCNRLLVLRRVGYSVDLCPIVEEFHSVLQKRADADAVLVTAGPVSDRRQVVMRTRSYSHAPLVLFNTSCDCADECEFDLVIAPLTHPEVWLRKIAALIERTRALNAAATVIGERSAQLMRDSEILETTVEIRTREA